MSCRAFACLPSSFIASSLLSKTGKHLCIPTWKNFSNNAKLKNLHRTFGAMIAVFLLLAAFTGALAQAQNGTPNWSAYDQHQIDTINLSNLNVVVNIPVTSKSGLFPISAALITNSGIGISGGYFVWGDSNNELGATTLPIVINNTFANGFGGSLFYEGIQLNVSCPVSGVTNKYTNWVVETADGTEHPLPIADFADSEGCLTGSGFTNSITIDGSGFIATVNKYGGPQSIYSKSGASIGFSSITDSNNNTISRTGSASAGYVYTDTMGIAEFTTNTGTSPTEVTWPTLSNGTASLTQTTAAYYLKSIFGCSTYTDYSDSSTQPLTTSATFPDSSSVGLAYEQTPGSGSSYRTGRISALSLRTGGIIEYNYNPNSAANDGINCTYGVPNEITRYTTDGTTSYTIAFQTTGGSCSTSTPCSTTTVIDPGGNEKVYYFSAGWQAASPTILALTEVDSFQNTGTKSTPLYSSTPTAKDVYCYGTTHSGQPGNCTTASVSLPIAEVDVYHTLGSMSTSSKTVTTYDSYGNVTAVENFDFGGSTLLSQVAYIYGSYNGTSCVAVSSTIYNKVCSLGIWRGAQQTTQEYFTYDSHGNLLKTYVGGYLTSGGWSILTNSNNNSYNLNGTLATSYDLANNETTYTYSSDGYSDCGSGGCSSLNLPFPTKITNVGTGLSTQATWDALGGVKLTGVGPNGSTQTTIYSYDGNCGSAADPFWRVGCVTDPLLNALGVSYLDSSNEVQTSFSFNSDNSVIDTTSKVDGYGRSIDFQKETGPSTGNYDTTSTSYSWPSAYFQTFNSTPCSTTSLGSGCGTTYGVTTLYDVLNRPTTITESGSNGVTTNTYYASGSNPDMLIVRGPAPTFDGENTKQVQNEYDGLGRVIVSCGILSSGGSSCGEHSNSVSGIETSYTYTWSNGLSVNKATRGAQTNSKTIDGLGRMTQSLSVDAGTWNYYYDSSTAITCPSAYSGAVGQLKALKDPNGNLICYKYDALNRVTGINANGTTCRHFNYDTTYGTVPSGVTTPTNTLGRLAEASTDNCSGTLITDEWFSYDKDGNKTDLWETTPNAGRYFHSTSTFAGNGAVLTVDLNDPNEYTNTYGLDGEGRWTSLVNSHVPQTQVSSVVYNAASQPTRVNIGSGTDNDAYTYDPNTGRMTQWVFTVGSANETGVLTWNPIGSLKTLAITDGFHSGGTQTCNMGNSTPSMGYDDLNRLLMYDCGSGGWGQTFSYDPYNNLTKAVISGRTGTTFNPGYNTLSGCSPCNNRYASAYTASYDSDGNQLYDPSNMDTYTWNEFSKLASVDMSGTGCSTSGECVIYDAFGRLVEVDSGTTYTETFYTQAGKGIFHGAVKVTGLWPAPGAGIVGDSTAFMHQDWLGNVRLGHTISTSSVTFDQALTPYGEMYATSGTASYGENNFTGDIQSIVSGTSRLWDTPNRELGAPSRWLSPDPAQSGWNPYAYVSNNPLALIDPLGLEACASNPYQGVCNGPGGGDAPGGGGGEGGGGGGAGIWSFNTCGSYCAPPPTAISSNGELQNAAAQATGVYLSCLSYNFQCDANGNYQPQYGYSFSGGNGSVLEQQTELAAITFAQLYATKQGVTDPNDVVDMIQQVYDQLSAQTPSLGGGNYDFSYKDADGNLLIQINGAYVDPNEFGCGSSRCGILDSLDYSHHDGTFHIDTGNPYAFPVGTLAHLGWDIVGGNTVWLVGGIPRPWWQRQP
jgi:RHS repeat-associated protein